MILAGAAVGAAEVDGLIRAALAILRVRGAGDGGECFGERRKSFTDSLLFGHQNLHHRGTEGHREKLSHDGHEGITKDTTKDKWWFDSHLKSSLNMTQLAVERDRRDAGAAVSYGDGNGMAATKASW